MSGELQDLLLTAQDVTAPSDESLCVEITVDNFEDVTSMSFTMHYDETHLQYQQVTNLTPNLPGFIPSDIFNPQPGALTVLHVDDNILPNTLPDGEVLFEACFLPLGNDGTCSDITFSGDIAAFEFADPDENVIPAFSESGTVCLNDATPGVVDINIGNNSGVDLNTDFCIPVTTNNFVDVATMAFTITYDESQLDFNNISNVTGSLPGFTIASSFDTSTPGVVYGRVGRSLRPNTSQ